MSTSTPRTRARAAKPKPAVKVAPADFLKVIEYLDTEIVVERALELRVLLLGMLAGVNVHLLGPPGTAKSLALRELTKAISGANYFAKTLHAQTPADAIIGGYDMSLFAAGGGLVRKVHGYMPWAHVVFLSELPRANGPTLDATLPMMNTEEREYEHNGGMEVSNILFAVTDSNTWFDPDNTQAQALSDRVTLMVMVHPIRSDESYKEMLRRHHDRRAGDRAGTRATNRVTITLEQLMEAQRQVDAVTLGPEYLDADAELRRNAKTKGLIISDRRWGELGRVARVSAWLAGRDHTIPDDNAVKEHGLWREEKDIATAGELVEQYHGRFVREAREKRSEAAKPLSMVEQIRPQVEGTPPNQELDPAVIKEAINASRAIDEVSERVNRVLDEAEREKRDASDLRDLANELLAVQKWFHSNNLPTRYKPNGS